MAGWTSFFSRDPTKDFPYEIKSKVKENPNLSVWTLNEGQKKGTDQPYTVFSVDLTACHERDGHLARGHLKRLKMMKHPNVLTYVDSLETDRLIYLVTESVVPLTDYLANLRLTNDQKDLLVSWGLFQVANALQFFSNDCKLIHHNINVHSVFVTHSGEWRLSGFEYVTPDTEGPSSRLSGLQKYDMPSAKLTGGKRSKPWCEDIWGFACLIWEIYNGDMTGANSLRTAKNIPKLLQPTYSKLIGPPDERPSPDEIIAVCRKPGGFMKNIFVETIQFLEEIQIKDVEQKNRFFSKLNESLDIFPSDIAKHKILPQLIVAYEFGNAGSAILAPLFKLGKLMDTDDYQKRIVPCVVKLFSSNDRSTRVKLLQQIEQFSEHLQAPVVNEKIFPSIMTGFMDTNPAVREATVKAMIHLSPKLNYHNLNVELMKYFAQLQSKDDQAIIRTNTTVCLGKIASYLHPQSRQKILVSAFTRALKDPFPPARNAGILALAGTQQFYHLAEVANRIIPCLSCLTCDPEKSVRDQAFKAVKGFLAKLEKASDNPELIPEMEAQVVAGSGSSILSGANVPSWAEWALGSLGSKFYNKPAAASTKPSTTVPIAKADGESKPTAVGLESLQSPSSGKTPARAEPTAAEGWDDLDEENWGDMDVASPQHQKDSMSKVKTPTAAVVDEAENGWDDDKDEWGSLETDGADQSTSHEKFFTSTEPSSKPISGHSHPQVSHVEETDPILAQFTKQSTKTAAVSAKEKSSDWGNWGEDTEVNKKALTAERAEQRKHQMELKKQQKQQGPMKLGAKKLNTNLD